MTDSARKGIILAGGTGSRLYPLTLGVSKQVLPVYSKPMVYYPLSLLMLARVREVLVISTPEDLPTFGRLLGDGSQWGMALSYAEQATPDGLAQALVIAAPFLDGAGCCLVLGDNVFYGNTLGSLLRGMDARAEGASVLAYPVKDPQRYGVIELDAAGRAVSLEEKPDRPRSRFVVPGLYFYDSQAPSLAERVTPSARGELEITSLNRMYLERGLLHAHALGRGVAWFDTGTPASLLEASNFVEAIEQRTGTMIACPEEIALANGWITRDGLAEQAERFAGSAYGQYLRGLEA